MLQACQSAMAAMHLSSMYIHAAWQMLCTRLHTQGCKAFMMLAVLCT
jgi:hypothetical protein